MTPEASKPLMPTMETTGREEDMGKGQLSREVMMKKRRIPRTPGCFILENDGFGLGGVVILSSVPWKRSGIAAR